MAADGQSAPLLVLSAPRSGASAVVGLLARGCGLDLGDVVRPAPDAWPSHESAAVANGHAALLAAHDRDWTCPPPDIGPASTGAGALRAAIADNRDRDGGWAVKDPRTLFTLPLWGAELEHVRLVAVVRDHAQVVGSLVGLGMAPWDADALARAYTARLRAWVDEFEVPVIDATEGPAALLARTAAVAAANGLRWDDEAARASLRTGLTARPVGLDQNDDTVHLQATGTQRLSIPVVPGPAVVRSAGTITTGGDLDLFVGPRAAARRQAVRDAVTRHGPPRLELMASVPVSDPTTPSDVRTAVVSDLVGLHQELGQTGERLGAVLLPDVLAWLEPQHLAPALEALHGGVRLDGVVAIGCGSAVDTARARRGWPVCTVEDLRSTARGASFLAVDHAVDDHLTVVLLLPLPTRVNVLEAAVRRPQGGRQPLEVVSDGVRSAVQSLRALLRRSRSLRAVVARLRAAGRGRRRSGQKSNRG